MKYLVEFSGFAYVEAEDEQEAMEKAEDGLYAYMEQEFTSVEEVEEFEVMF